MKINRQALVQHLEKISCKGQIPGVVFTEAFEAAALTEDQLLLVIAPGLEKVEPLPQEVGVPDLGILIKSLAVLAGAGNEATMVDVSVESHRLVLDEEHRGKVRLMTANVSTIGTKISDDVLAKLLAKAPTKGGIPLTKSMIDGIEKTFSLLKAQEVELVVGKKGGKAVIGNENSHDAHFDIPTLKTSRGQDEYSLLFGKHLVDVLSGVTSFADAEMFLSGPGSFVVIQDGAYKYILSPRSRGQE